ncbi:hypothetical protein PG997_014389 [Apiospora hydei]|uniref:Uncharacterized protein n=1 Tax=Apiospora hydei TaxID=1337664 RepID=A0ABR1UTS1_9PEZI
MLFSKSAIAAFFGAAVAREGVHFDKCSPANYEVVNYYADDSKANVGTISNLMSIYFSLSFPGASNTCVASPNWHSLNHCTYPTGTPGTWNLASNAESQPIGSVVGTFNNGYHTFTCKRDDDHYAYTDGNGNRCVSVFYCLY